jgi:hypothetical protein
MDFFMKKLLKIFLSVLLPFCGYANSESKASTAEKTPFIEYHNRFAVFTFNHQVYERIKPDAFYVGLEGWITESMVTNKNHSALIAEGECRLGYNLFYNGRDHLTPFIGGGVFQDLEKYHVHRVERRNDGNLWLLISRHKLPLIGYGTLGVLYDHEFNSIFTLGMNVKGILGGSKHSHLEWGSPIFGVDGALPITFRFGNKRHWDLRMEPFDIYLHGSKISRNYLGFRSSFGYRF